MLLVSEAHFFDQPAPHYKEQEENGYARRLHWKPLNRDYCRPAAIESTLPFSAFHCSQLRVAVFECKMWLSGWLV